MADLDFPAGLVYSSEHEWVARTDDDAVVRVGITDYAQDSLGDVVYVEAPAVGDSVTAGESCGEVESTKSVSELIAPVSGEVLAVNDALEDAPETLNSTPYEAGWIYELRLSDPSELDGLMDADAYRAAVDGEGS